MVRGETHFVPTPFLAQILLPVHVRVSLQSRRHCFFLLITRYTQLFDDWRGYLIAGFSLVWLANVYMSFFGRLRLEISEHRLEVAAAESRERDDTGMSRRKLRSRRGPAS